MTKSSHHYMSELKPFIKYATHHTVKIINVNDMKSYCHGVIQCQDCVLFINNAATCNPNNNAYNGTILKETYQFIKDNHPEYLI